VIAVVDMGIGNLQSVLEAFRRVGAATFVTSSAEEVTRAEAVVLPGVGAFGDGMESLREKGLVEPLRRHAADGRPLFGICLGMQLLAEESEEHGRHAGLGILPGRVVRLAPTSRTCRVPNMGWCDVHPVPRPDGKLFARVPHGEAFYFAHSYHVSGARPEHVAAMIEYDGGTLAAALEHDNIFGIQFHPEKSQDAGLEVVAAFIDAVRTLPVRA